MSARKVLVFESTAELEEAAAREVVRTVENAVARRGRCLLALAGGSTPRGLYARLAEEPYRSKIDWLKLHLFWGDERCVPPEAPESNYRMARETFLDIVPASERTIHRIRVELGAEQAAVLYEEEIRKVSDTDRPRFDLIILGMGPDGHTASLFPETPGLKEKRRLVIPTTGPTPPRGRVSITFRAINAARKVMFLVRGEEKACVLAEVLESNKSTEGGLPASLVKPRGGRVLWLVDRAASSLVS